MKLFSLSIKRLLLLLLLLLCATGSFVLWQTVQRLDQEITTRFEGRRWELPARIYARPLELYPGKKILKTQMLRELNLLGYRRDDNLDTAGTYRTDGAHIGIHARAFHFTDGLRADKKMEFSIKDGQISAFIDDRGRKIPLFALEPLQIATIYPGDNEDRILVHLADTPPLLIKMLLLTEDRKFYQHIGVRPTAILRALLANIKAGKTVQGGSTLTQQLVKNFFLTSEQSLTRKINEALMALLLEYHYSKDEILETYINEIYLGQNGNHAVHGFATASRFYFKRNINELTAGQIAMLVGLAKGASFYDPRKHPARAKKRRDFILAASEKAGLLPTAAAQQFRKLPISVIEKQSAATTRYPAFIELVRRQLTRDYRDEDLQSEGLFIFTTLDPIIQQQAEDSLAQILAAIEHERKMAPDSLQGAVVVCSVDQGEVQAVVGDRRPGRAGFNRALDMQRPVGSVIKPGIYLSALDRPDKYNLLTMLDDAPLSIPVKNGNWQPENYDKHFHGPVTLREALIHSMNVPTVRLGMNLGLNTVIGTLHKLGINREISPYPALLLGALDLAPVQVLQMYQTLAAGGYQSPLRTILAVMDQENRLLQRYPLTVEQAAKPAPVFCINTVLHEITKTGTAGSLQHLLPPTLKVAGKTGTTNDLRDSWFAGFSNSQVAVSWIGRDDNKSTGLTGASGALRVWADLMKHITTTPLDLQPPAGIDLYFSDVKNGRLFADQCRQGELIPFIHGGLLPPVTTCPAAVNYRQAKRLEKRERNAGKPTLEQRLRQLLRIFQ